MALEYKTLSVRIAEVHEQANRDILTQKKAEEILQTLLHSKLLKNDSIKSTSYISTDPYYNYFGLHIHDVPLEFVISELCPPLRAKYNCTFCLEVSEYNLTLSTHCRGLAIYIHVYEDSMRECELVPQIEIRSEEEVQEYRVKRSFKIRCD